MDPFRGHAPLAHLEVNDVWQLTGVKTWGWSFPATQVLPQSASDPGEWVLLLVWDGALRFLDLWITVKTPAGPALSPPKGGADSPGSPAQPRQGSETSFSPDPQEARKLLADLGLADRVGAEYDSADGRPRRRLLIGRARAGQTANLVVRIDTDDETFLSRSDALPPESHRGLVVPLSLVAARKPADDSRLVGQQQDVTLCLRPAQRLPSYEGVVGLDLGMTSSTLVGLPLSGDEVSDIQVVNVEGVPTAAGDPPPVPSAVRLFEYTPDETDSRAVPPATWAHGRRAMTGAQQGWLVLGGRRMVRDAAATQRWRVWLGNRTVDVPRQLPMELFVTSLFKAFFAQQGAIPARMALTCPADASSPEVHALGEIVFRAWLRALQKKQYESTRADIDRLIPLVLDEASAAALYFLYRDQVQDQGGLRVFRYLYPRGQNLLLIDVGGGSTGITLVHCRAPSLQDLSLQVRGRSGLRDFGGEDITAAVFRLLKARIAERLTTLTRRAHLAVPPDSSRLLGWLRSNARAIDAIVPTFFNPDQVGQAPYQEHWDAAFDLWQIAERFKFELSAQAPRRPCRLSFNDPEMPLVRHLMAHHSLRSPRECLTILEETELRREEVDALIREQVRKCIDNANRLLAARLRPDEDVHTVYLLGNASRYPLVAEVLRQDLQVHFLDGDPATGTTGRLFIDDSNRKHAVAKGAALALKLRERLEGINLELDTRLTDRLPFDILYRDIADGDYRVLFHEDNYHTDLLPAQVPVPRPEDREQNVTTVFLARAWPGEERPKPYLRFQFDEPVRGPLEVRCVLDEGLPRFVMKDAGRDYKEAIGEELSDAPAVALVDSGTL
jgi:hypothetical protein